MEEVLGVLEKWECPDDLFRAVEEAQFNEKSISKERTKALKDYQQRSWDNLSRLHTLFTRKETYETLRKALEDRLTDNTVKKCLIMILWKRGEFYSTYAWNNEALVTKYHELISFLEEKTDFSEKRMLEILHSDIIQHIQSQIIERESQKDEMEAKWNIKSPTLKYILLYITENIPEHCYSEELLRRIMPFAFDLIDEFGVKNKVIGLKIFRIFGKQVQSKSFHCSENLLVAIFEQLRASIVYRDLEVVSILFPMLLDYHQGIISSYEKRRVSSETFALFASLQNEMERSCTTTFRRIYVRTMRVFLPRMGLFVVPHLKRLLQALSVLFQWPDTEIRYCAIDIVNFLCNIAWPRIPYHLESILEGLSLAYQDVLDSPTSDEQMLPQIEALMNTVFACCATPKQKHKFLEQIQIAKKHCPSLPNIQEKQDNE